MLDHKRRLPSYLYVRPYSSFAIISIDDGLYFPWPKAPFGRRPQGRRPLYGRRPCSGPKAPCGRRRLYPQTLQQPFQNPFSSYCLWWGPPVRTPVFTVRLIGRLAKWWGPAVSSCGAQLDWSAGARRYVLICCCQHLLQANRCPISLTYWCWMQHTQWFGVALFGSLSGHRSIIHSMCFLEPIANTRFCLHPKWTTCENAIFA